MGVVKRRHTDADDAVQFSHKTDNGDGNVKVAESMMDEAISSIRSRILSGADFLANNESMPDAKTIRRVLRRWTNDISLSRQISGDSGGESSDCDADAPKEPGYIQQTWFGALLIHLCMCSIWVLGAGAVALPCGLLAGYTYGTSFFIFATVAIKQRYLRQAWALLCLVVYAALGPHQAVQAGFVRYWVSWVFLSVSAIFAWFWDFEPCPALRHFVTAVGFKQYYRRCELRVQPDTVLQSKSLFGFHPHGILSVGYSCNGVWSEKFHSIAGPDSLFLVDKVLREDNPYFKVLCDLHGGIETLNRKSLVEAMKAEKNICFVPGGFEDATCMVFREHQTVMTKRTGFIKYALQHGYRLHPVYSFGESETYHTMNSALSFRLWLNKFGIPAAVFFGWPFFPMLPRPQAKIVTCVGKAIELPKIDEPTSEDIVKWHKVYCDALVALFDEHKSVSKSRRNTVLHII